MLINRSMTFNTNIENVDKHSINAFSLFANNSRTLENERSMCIEPFN